MLFTAGKTGRFPLSAGSTGEVRGRKPTVGGQHGEILTNLETARESQKCVGKSQISRKSRKRLGPYDSAPRPQMTNGVQGGGQRAPSGHSPGKDFRRFSRRIPPPRSAKSGNTTITHVWRTQCSLCCNGGTARAGSRRNSGFSEIFSVFLSPIITAGEFLRNPPGLKILVLRHFSSMRTLAREGS